MPRVAPATVGQSRPPAGKQLLRSFRRDSLGGGDGSSVYPTDGLLSTAALPPQPRQAPGRIPKVSLTREAEPDEQEEGDDAFASSAVAKTVAQSDTIQRVDMSAPQVFTAFEVASTSSVRVSQQKPVQVERAPFDASSTLKALSSALLRRASLPLRLPRSLKRQSGALPPIEQVAPPLVFESRSADEVPRQTITRAPLQPQSNVEQLSSAFSSISISKNGGIPTSEGYPCGIVASATAAGSENIKVRLSPTVTTILILILAVTGTDGHIQEQIDTSARKGPLFSLIN